jgi:hypothetical protein
VAWVLAGCSEIGQAMAFGRRPNLTTGSRCRQPRGHIEIGAKISRRDQARGVAQRHRSVEDRLK